jgi:hypothetical protein
MVAWLEAQSGRAAVTFTMTIVPERSPAAGDHAPPEAGRVVSMVSAAVNIAPDGSVSACRETARQMPLPLPMLALPPDICAFAAGPRLRFAEGPAGVDRPGRIVLVVQLRRDEPPARTP